MHPQIYGELSELADAGWIEIDSECPRGRKVYRITDAGRAVRASRRSCASTASCPCRAPRRRAWRVLRAARPRRRSSSSRWRSAGL
ncbi:PadR family transcriptional regulator [Glycomyces buryatensis]|uniref:PadR family transcriptional regulator n=1 Tax=Glycomyces buryatensis TaxID=2570927 RepID=A0A4S8PVT1_9ACTN|nr:PadR family transcriptional regulator [Glycomyces buryatensis]